MARDVQTTSTPHAHLDEDSLPSGWTISTTLPHHTALYHAPTGRSLAGIKDSNGGGWAVRGLANYGGGALFGRGVDPQRAATLLQKEVAAGSAGNWTDNPDPGLDDDAADPEAPDAPEDSTDDPGPSAGQTSLEDW